MSVNASPARRSTGPIISPTRIFGPLRSWRIATGTFNRVAAARIQAMLRRCSSCVPCEKFNRATFMPARISASIIVGLFVAGPRVQTIFVRRIMCTIL